MVDLYSALRENTANADIEPHDSHMTKNWNF